MGRGGEVRAGMGRVLLDRSFGVVYCMQVEVLLREVLAELAEDLREYSVGPDAAWPGLLVFVGADGGSGS